MRFSGKPSTVAILVFRSRRKRPPPSKSVQFDVMSEDRNKEEAVSKKSYSPEDIVARYKKADILMSQSKSVAETIKKIGVSDAANYRCRIGYGGKLSPPSEAFEKT